MRPVIGVTAGPAQLQRALGLPKGVALVQVQPQSPAARAGLQPFRRARDGGVVAGDVITGVDDEAVTDLDDMLTLLERRQPGERVTLSVWRSGNMRKVGVTLAVGE